MRLRLSWSQLESIEAAMEDGVLTVSFIRIPPDEKPRRELASL